MTHVVTEACIGCKYTDCVEVCPVDCFHAGPNFIVIDPDECIDCALCVPECPVEAIYEASEVPEPMRPYIELNARYSKLWPVINARTEPLPDAERWAQVKNKLSELQTG